MTVGQILLEICTTQVWNWAMVICIEIGQWSFALSHQSQQCVTDAQMDAQTNKTPGAHLHMLVNIAVKFHDCRWNSFVDMRDTSFGVFRMDGWTDGRTYSLRGTCANIDLWGDGWDLWGFWEYKQYLWGYILTTPQVSWITCGRVTPQVLLTLLPAPWTVHLTIIRDLFFPQVSWIYYPTSTMENLWTSHPTCINITPRTMNSSPFAI